MNNTSTGSVRATKKLIPELRFPEFVNDGEWVEDILNNIASFRRGSFPQPYGLPEWYDNENGMPFIQVYDVGDDYRLKPKTKSKISKLAAEQSVFIQKGTVIITIQGSIGRVAITQYDAYVDRTLLLFEEFYNEIDKTFFAYVLFLLFEIEKEKAPGGIIKTITKEVLSDFVIKIPKLKEQQKIASCLSSLDEVIAANSQKLEALKQHKKGLMQNLFPQEGESIPKWRFPEFVKDSEWAEKSLGEVGEFIGGGTPDTSISEYWSGEIQWYTPTEIKNGIVRKSLRTITNKGLQNSSAKLLPSGTILITTRATIGDVGIAKEPCTTNQGFQSLIVKKRQHNIFWYYWLIQHKYELTRKASGSTFPEIGKNEIIKILSLSPQITEQQKIASCLSALDELITAQSEKIEQLKLHKKGLMQGLFPSQNR